MELSQLKYFYEAAKLQHITKAANKLHVAQPALSQAIHRLEAELKVPLFAAKGRNIILTEYGIYLMKKLEPVIDTLEQLPIDLELMANLLNTTIHMNVMSASTIVTSSVIEYKKHTPDINFQLFQHEEESLCDVSVSTRLFYQSRENKLDNEYVFTEQIYLAVPNIKKYHEVVSVELEDFSEADFICLAGNKQFGQICEKYCSHAGFNPRIIFESDNLSAVKNMIAAGLGVGFWPQYSWGQLDTEDVLLLPIKTPLCQRDIVVVYNENKADSSEVKKYFNFLVEYFETLKRGNRCIDY